MKAARLRHVAVNIVEKSDGTEMPFLGLEHLAGGTGQLLVEAPPKKSADDSLKHRAGDVLFGKLRPYLSKSYLAPSDGTATSELLVLRPTSELDAHFLKYVTLSRAWLDWAEMTSFGSKMPRTSWDALAEFRLKLPPLEKQRRIADFLDAETSHLDHLEAIRSRQSVCLVERSKTAVDQIFQMDESFAQTRLKHLLSMRPRYGVLVPEFVDEGVPFIRVNDLLNLKDAASRLPRISRSLSRQHGRTVVQADDLLVSVVGTLGRSVVADGSLAGANIARAVASLRLRCSVDVHLLCAWFASSMFEEQALLATGSDTAQPTLGMEDLAGFRLRWPTDLSGQAKAADALLKLNDSMSRLGRTLSQQRLVLSERRQALITVAVTGQIDVTTARGVDVS